VKPRPGNDARHEKRAEKNKLSLGMDVQHVQTKQPLGKIKKIDARGVHVERGSKPYHPDWVEPVP